MDDLARFGCLNPSCTDYGRRGGHNLVVAYRYGAEQQYRVLRCRTCKARFSERKGTPLYRSHLPEAQVVSLLEHLTEGCGIRKTERLVKVHRDTVMRYGRLAGDHAHDLHDELVAFSPSDPRGPIR
jgi:transposase-like protein